MDQFHERLARCGLAAGAEFGMVPAGGYAVQENGFLERPSEDVDLFMAWSRRNDFRQAATAVIAAYQAEGLVVEVAQDGDTFVRLFVTDTGVSETTKVELAVDARRREPVLRAIGPVLHPDDVVGNKMSALFGRYEARDFIDVEAAGRSGRYSREAMLELASEADGGFDPGMFADVIHFALAELPDRDFEAYNVSGHRLAELRSWFADWREELRK